VRYAQGITRRWLLQPCGEDIHADVRPHDEGMACVLIMSSRDVLSPASPRAPRFLIA
jgi:hypothetical protein